MSDPWYKRQGGRQSSFPPDNIMDSRFQTAESEFHQNQTQSILIRQHASSLYGTQHVTKEHGIHMLTKHITRTYIST